MLTNLKIGSRLAVGFGAVLLLLCLVAAIGVFQASRINERVVDQTENWLASVRLLGDIRSQANVLRRSSLRHVLELNKAGKDVQRAIHDDTLEKKWPVTTANYAKTVSSPEEARMFEEIKSLWNDFLVIDRKMLALSEGGAASFDEARQLSVGASAVAFAKVLKVIEDDVALNAAGSLESARVAAETYRSVIWFSAGSVVVALLIGTALSVVITRSIAQPIQRAVKLAAAVAEGDLSSRIEVTGSDETAQLLHALSRMNGNLADIVGQVRSSSDSIATGSSQIATGNVDLSQRTEEQASNLQQTAASMEELSGTVKSNADTCSQADKMARQASVTATVGGQKVGAVVATMQDIAASSNKIADIISVIDGIAFQTNILALNAAVEAARAGEQGRGFAVVATEVRTLAGRSAEAAKEIKALINASVEKVTVGTQQVDDAGSAMNEIVAQVRHVSQLIGEISTATAEQSTGIAQVGDAVIQLDQATQQNAALVEESAAAAESLKSQAALLNKAVRVFKLASTA